MYLPDVFKALGDRTRLRILNLLSNGRELCVCQIEEVLMLSQPNASRHLNRLRYAGLISCRRFSQWCFYRLSEELKTEKNALLQILRMEWESDAQYTLDLNRLHMPLMDKGCNRILEMFRDEGHS